MPRVCSSTSDPYDYCLKCFPMEAIARSLYGNKGDGPDGRGNCFEWDTDHPPYGGNDYRCVKCRRELTDDDNYPS